MKYIYSTVLTLLFVGGISVSNVHAETTSVSGLLEQIKTLMAKVEELQKQITSIRSEVTTVLKAGLSEGSENEDVKKIQEFLAKDRSLYPEGKVTGYFGTLTKEAIRRFQNRHGLTATGIVDDTTRVKIEKYMKEGTQKASSHEILKKKDATYVKEKDEYKKKVSESVAAEAKHKIEEARGLLERVKGLWDEEKDTYKDTGEVEEKIEMAKYKLGKAQEYVAQGDYAQALNYARYSIDYSKEVKKLLQ